MPVRAHTGWTVEKLWRQEQVNFRAHINGGRSSL